MKGAVIDVGSNSVLLLIGETDGHQIEPIFESSCVTGLGRNVKSTGILLPEAVEHTLEALRSAFEQADLHEAAFVTARGTMALRIATDAESFFSKAKAQGTPVEILSGQEEARLGFQSIAEDPEFSSDASLALVDPGGHSTELVIASQKDGDWTKKFEMSLPIGALGLLSTSLTSESPNGLDLLRATCEIDAVINQGFDVDPDLKVVTVGATGTNLISLRERLAIWEPQRVHGQWLDYEEVSKAVGFLAKLNLEERSRLIGLEPGRESTIHAGSLILERFLYALRAEGCFVSVQGWRHALLREEARARLAHA